MILFPRRTTDPRDRRANLRAWAHCILDQWKAGVWHPQRTIQRALKLTGDAT